MDSNWIFHSKNGDDEYISLLAQSCNATPVSHVDYAASMDPIVVRGILKHKIMKQCWQDSRTFYYMDSGYFGNDVSPANRRGQKLWHRIVKNNLQHNDIVSRPDDRWIRHDITLHPRKYGSKIIVAAPDEKPCTFYGIDRQQWIDQTVATLKQHTDRPVIVRERAPLRADRIRSDPLRVILQDDVHAVVTFNSIAALESVMLGVPAFTLAPVHAAAPVTSQDLSQIDTPYWPDQDKLYAWCCHLAYGQFHNVELKNGTAYRILNDN